MVASISDQMSQFMVGQMSSNRSKNFVLSLGHSCIGFLVDHVSDSKLPGSSQQLRSAKHDPTFQSHNLFTLKFAHNLSAKSFFVGVCAEQLNILCPWIPTTEFRLSNDIPLQAQ